MQMFQVCFPGLWLFLLWRPWLFFLIVQSLVILTIFAIELLNLISSQTALFQTRSVSLLLS